MTNPTLRRPQIAPPAHPRSALGWAGALALAGAVALWLAADAGVKGPSAVPDVARGVLGTVLLFGACGFAPTELLVPPLLRPYRALLVVPVGAAVTGLGLTFLCFAGVRFHAALITLVAVCLLAAVVVAVRGRGDRPGRQPAGTPAWPLRVGAPAYLAVLIVAVALIPVFRSGHATVVGQNGDAVQAVGTADFLRAAPPTTVRPDLPTDRMPPVWRSKYPIYYALAAATEVSGLSSIQAFASVMAVLLGLVALGAYLLAVSALRAPPAAALLAMTLVALDRIVMFLTIHPFHNQIWGVFALMFILVLGFDFLRAPSRRSAALFAAFFALEVFAYPLALPFPLVTLGVAAIVLRRAGRRSAQGPPRWIAALRLPRGGRSLLLWVPLGLVAIPLAGLLVVGAVEKAVSAIGPILPGGDLRPWNALPEYLPFHRFFGLVDPWGISWLLVAGVLAAAAAGLRSVPRDARLGLGSTAVGALLFSAYFKARSSGAFFYFKDLSFLGPLVMVLAAIGLGALASVRDRAARAVGVVGAVVLTTFVVAGSRAEIGLTFDFFTPQLAQVGRWSDRLPANASVRVDLPFSGEQLWVNRELHRHPLSVVYPAFGTTFMHPPVGRKADYILAPIGGAPRDHLGGPLFHNSRYALYRQRRGTPGRDHSSRRDVVIFSSVFD